MHDNIQKPIVYHGGGGTGKTFSLIHAIKQTLAAGTQPDKVLFLGYNTLSTRAAGNQTRKLLGAIKSGFTTLPSFCLGLLKNSHVEFGFVNPPVLVTEKEREELFTSAVMLVGEKMFPTEPGYDLEVAKTFDTLIKKACKVGLEDIPTLVIQGIKTIQNIQTYLSSFKLVLIDDAQELRYEELKLVEAWSKLTQVVLAGDSNSISAQKADVKAWQALLSSNVSVISLTKSYRSKSWMCDFINQVSDYNDIKNPYNLTTASITNLTSQIYAIQVDDSAHQLKWIASQCQNCLKAREDITVGIICRTYSDANMFATGLPNEGIQTRWYRLKNRIDTIQFGKERVIVGTADTLKGIAFSAVIFPNAIEGTWPFFNEVSIEAARRQFVSGISKAQAVCYFVIPRVSITGRQTSVSRFMKEGNSPELTVHGLTSR